MLYKHGQQTSVSWFWFQGKCRQPFTSMQEVKCWLYSSVLQIDFSVFCHEVIFKFVGAFSIFTEKIIFSFQSYIHNIRLLVCGSSHIFMLKIFLSQVNFNLRICWVIMFFLVKTFLVRCRSICLPNKLEKFFPVVQKLY